MDQYANYQQNYYILWSVFLHFGCFPFLVGLESMAKIRKYLTLINFVYLYYFSTQEYYYSISMPTFLNKLSLAIIITQLVFISFSYTLQGEFILHVDSSFKNIQPKTPIYFEFSKSIQNTTIVNQLTVYACSLISFQYYLNQNVITFELTKIGMNRRECIKDEVAQIIKRLEKVASTVTIGDSLLFFSASGRNILQLSKYQKPKSQLSSLSGVWQVYQVFGERAYSILQINKTDIQLCKGNGAVDYVLGKQPLVNFKIKKTKGCSDNDLFNSFYNSKFVRRFYRELWFYDEGVQIVMKWDFKGQLDPFKPLEQITQPTNQSNQTNKTITNISVSQNITTIPITPNVTVQSKNQTIVSSGNIIVLNVIKTPIEPIKNSQTSNITSTNKTTPVQNSSITVKQEISLTIEKKPTISQNVTAPQPPKSVQSASPTKSNTDKTKLSLSAEKQEIGVLKNIKKQELLLKFYLVGGTKQVMLVLTANKIMIYGDCGVWFSSIQLKDSSEGRVLAEKVQLKNSSQDCLNKGNILEKAATNLRWFTIRENEKKQRFLQFRDKENKVLGEWANFKQK